MRIPTLPDLNDMALANEETDGILSTTKKVIHMAGHSKSFLAIKIYLAMCYNQRLYPSIFGSDI